MSILEVSLLSGCQVNCPYCAQGTYIRERNKRGGDLAMSLETFERCLSTVPKNVEIVFAGMAEPFLNLLAPAMMALAASNGHEVSVYSTLVGLDVTKVPELAKIEFKEFCIHVPDASGQMHVNLDEQYLATFAAACAMLPRRHFTCIGTPHPKLAPLLPRLNDDSPGLLSRAGNVPGRAIPRKTGRLKELPCMRHGVLLPNGEVALCCMDYALKEILGNLKTTPYTALYEGEAYRRIVRGLSDEREDIICRHCEVAECVGK